MIWADRDVDKIVISKSVPVLKSTISPFLLKKGVLKCRKDKRAQKDASAHAYFFRALEKVSPNTPNRKSRPMHLSVYALNPKP